MLVPATLFVFLPHRFLLATNFNFSAGQSLLSACLVKVRLVMFPQQQTCIFGEGSAHHHISG
jgi:hypothetical protein